MNIRTFQNEQEFIQAGVNFILALFQGNSRIVRIALSGGSTPSPLYKALAESENLPFGKTEFYQVDERYVPADHKDSNQKMIDESLLQPLSKKYSAEKLPHWFPFNTNIPIADAVIEYQKRIKDIPEQTLDLMILGIGPDGHIASLFPNSSALQEKKELVLHTQTNEFAVKDRLTLTLPTILKSKKILILLKGSEKKQILEQLQAPQNSIKTMPAYALIEHPELTIHYLGG